MIYFYYSLGVFLYICFIFVIFLALAEAIF